ncbi:MAG: GNAT family N-acetyltransferase [Nitrospinaceae bacterium]|jgi:ribosomal-protein-alanine N-acetyltransferase|nr:GNAT family N-acetyltransferase [Nitrospinaceae bacterium]MDP6734890.1 GNAT family N-acetyltransferase [Nitrospinaceae bacterium]|tara:strand:- start:82 stop:561 length:480 start_codon:yes stop_codon:yes gene_type:complete
MPLSDAFEKFPQLKTKNLLLRRMHISDANTLYNVLSDEAVTEFYDDDAFTDVAQAIDQIEAWERGYNNRGCIRWGITSKDDGFIIGSCGYYGFHTWNLRASIGYELKSSHWRRGIMTEALRAMIDFGFGELELNRIEAVVMPANIILQLAGEAPSSGFP